MPRKGWKCVSLREEYFEQLERQAGKERRSVAGLLEKLLIDKKLVKPVQEVAA